MREKEEEKAIAGEERQVNRSLNSKEVCPRAMGTPGGIPPLDTGVR